MFNNGLNFYWGDHIIYPLPEFAKVVRSHWIKFAKEFVEEYWMRGVIPIAISTVDNPSDPDHPYYVPKIPRGEFRITVRYDYSKQEYEYKFYRVRNKRNGKKLDKPKWDQHVRILSGYGYGNIKNLQGFVFVFLTGNLFRSGRRWEIEIGHCHPHRIGRIHHGDEQADKDGREKEMRSRHVPRGR